MKVYGPKGEVYEGEAVDCRELMQVGGYTKEPPTQEQIAAAAPVEAKGPAPADKTADADATDAGKGKGKSAKVGGKG